MTDVQVDAITLALDAASVRKDRLQKAFSDLNDCRSIIANFTSVWHDLEQHFSEIEKLWKQRIDELRDKEQAFVAKSEEQLQLVGKREEAISQREEASLARLQEQKDLAIAAIFEERRKWNEEKKASKSEGVEGKNALKAEGTDISVSADERIASQDDALTAKTNDVKETGAAANGSATQAVDADSSQVASGDVVGADEVVSNKTSDKDDGSSPAKVSEPEMKVRKQLKTLCENMDGGGVRNYLVEHRKHMGAIRFELPPALQFAIDPARLVLHALEGYPTEHGDSQTNEKEVGASALRRSCILLLEVLASVLVDPLIGENHIVVSPSIKDSAKEMADKLKSKLDLKPDPATGTSLEAQTFLQLLATFGIASEYDTDELCNLVMTIANRKQLPALCKSLGLAARVPDILNKLSKEGKAVEVLALAQAFGMMDKIQPVPLLKAYLKEARKTAQSIMKNGNNSPAAQADSTVKELAALKAVLKCIEEYKLEAQYSPVPLQRSLAQLEKAKFDRKRAAVAVKAKAKRPRGTVTVGGSGVYTPSADRGLLKPSDRGQLSNVGLLSYGLSSQSSYDRRLPPSYAATYAGGVRNPVSLSNSFPYTADGLGSQVYGSSPYTNPSGTYGGYQFGSGLPPPSLAYQSSFLH